MKKADKTLVFTTLLCLLPMAAGLFLWDRLPQEMPIHWNAAGQVDNYGSRALAVVGLPCIMAGATCWYTCCCAPTPVGKT